MKNLFRAKRNRLLPLSGQIRLFLVMHTAQPRLSVNSTLVGLGTVAIWATQKYFCPSKHVIWRFVYGWWHSIESTSLKPYKFFIPGHKLGAWEGGEHEGGRVLGHEAGRDHQVSPKIWEKRWFEEEKDWLQVAWKAGEGEFCGSVPHLKIFALDERKSADFQTAKQVPYWPFKSRKKQR